MTTEIIHIATRYMEEVKLPNGNLPKTPIMWCGEYYCPDRGAYTNRSGEWLLEGPGLYGAVDPLMQGPNLYLNLNGVTMGISHLCVEYGWFRLLEEELEAMRYHVDELDWYGRFYANHPYLLREEHMKPRYKGETFHLTGLDMHKKVKYGTWELT